MELKDAALLRSDKAIRLKFTTGGSERFSSFTVGIAREDLSTLLKAMIGIDRRWAETFRYEELTRFLRG